MELITTKGTVFIMKRVFILVISAMLMLTTAFAEEAASVKSMSDSELISLYNITRAEMIVRNLVTDDNDSNKGTAKIVSGTYRIGEDIPAGRFTFTYVCETGSHDCVRIRVYDPENQLDTWTIIDVYEGDYTLTLTEGWNLSVGDMPINCAFYVRKATPLFTE